VRGMFGLRLFSASTCPAMFIIFLEPFALIYSMLWYIFIYLYMDVSLSLFLFAEMPLYCENIFIKIKLYLIQPSTLK